MTQWQEWQQDLLKRIHAAQYDRQRCLDVLHGALIAVLDMPITDPAQGLDVFIHATGITHSLAELVELQNKGGKG